MDLEEIVKGAVSDRSLKKIVFSKPSDRSVLKAYALPFDGKSGTVFQLTVLKSDNKSLQKNYTEEELGKLLSETSEAYRQTDVITANGSCTAMRGKNGNEHIKNNIIRKKTDGEFGPHNREKNYILSDASAVPFLTGLGICSPDGRIYDKKQPKFRQVNRFLELIEDVYPSLPAEGALHFCDLCCGKAYLTFAVYWYFTKVKARDVEITGVDLKKDVIASCADLAEKLGYAGMKFICANALEFTPPFKPDMVISLHACDIATDIVLASAVKNGAGVILSTPCCHHEMFSQISSDELSFITRFPILKQKLCDAATDSLRGLRLEIENYSVEAVELIDPDETPKNVLLRAVKRKTPLAPAKKEKLEKEYREAAELLGANPKLDILLKTGKDG